jgi:hypothetical protein
MASNKISDNKTTTKRKAPPHAWKKGQSGNPKGAPKRGESWAEIIKRVGEMTPGEAAQQSLTLAQKLLSIGEGVTLKEAVVLRVYAALLFEPDARMFNAIMDRADGKMTQTIAQVDWREEARKQGIDPDELSRTLTEQFTTAMVRASASGGVGSGEEPGG